MSEMDRLREIMARLRGPGGCPWDREQTFETLATYLVEEAYEALEAAARGSAAARKEGDAVSGSSPTTAVSGGVMIIS